MREFKVSRDRLQADRLCSDDAVPHTWPGRPSSPQHSGGRSAPAVYDTGSAPPSSGRISRSELHETAAHGPTYVRPKAQGGGICTSIYGDLAVAEANHAQMQFISARSPPSLAALEPTQPRSAANKLFRVSA